MVTKASPKITLRNDDALALWRQGKDYWNEWVKNNPHASVDFSGVDFSKERLEQSPDIDFSEFTFPDGDITFWKANFGDGYVDFSNTTFGNGKLNFSQVTFGKGTKSFCRASFKSSTIEFNGSAFNDGMVDFSRAIINNSSISFWGATFGYGHVSFYKTSFGNGNIKFFGANFGDGNVNFSEAEFGKCNIDFEYCKFNGHLKLFNLKKSTNIQSLSFKHATFHQSFDISGNTFHCVPDLTFTEKAHQLSLDSVKCEPKRSTNNHCFIAHKINDKSDIPKLRRLKEIAEESKDYERALDFHAREMRAKRWHVNTSFWGLLLDYSFDFFSNYGRSEKRPLFWLFVTWIFFAIPYFLLSPVKHFGFNGSVEKFSEALSFSAGQMIPFIPGSKLARSEGVTTLFGGDLSFGLHLLTFSQSLISFVFLFLIGLALRNRFRI